LLINSKVLHEAQDTEPVINLLRLMGAIQSNDDDG
jgi:hypothetical protein